MEKKNRPQVVPDIIFNEYLESNDRFPQVHILEHVVLGRAIVARDIDADTFSKLTLSNNQIEKLVYRARKGHGENRIAIKVGDPERFQSLWTAFRNQTLDSVASALYSATLLPKGVIESKKYIEHVLGAESLSERVEMFSQILDVALEVLNSPEAQDLIEQHKAKLQVDFRNYLARRSGGRAEERQVHNFRVDLSFLEAIIQMIQLQVRASLPEASRIMDTDTIIRKMAY
jgi:hypothetical protein